MLIFDIITKKCRIFLRYVVFVDEEKIFCNLFGRNLLNSFENDEEGFFGFSGMVFRFLDFRIIDLRLVVGVYGGLYEVFFEDVCEVIFYCWVKIVLN